MVQQFDNNVYKRIEYIYSLPISLRAKNILLRHGIFTKSELEQVNYGLLLSFRYCGEKIATEIMDCVEKIKQNDTNKPIYLEDWLNTLDNRTRNILSLKLDGLTLGEIGQRFGISRSRVKQIINKALRRAINAYENVYENKYLYFYKKYSFMTYRVMYGLFDISTRVYRYFELISEIGTNNSETDFENDPETTVEIYGKYLALKQIDHDLKLKERHDREMKKYKDIFDTNPHFYLTAVDVVKRKDANKPGYITMIRCKCKCGNFTDVLPPYIRKGKTKSCGCIMHNWSVTHPNGGRKKKEQGSKSDTQ